MRVRFSLTLPRFRRYNDHMPYASKEEQREYQRLWWNRRRSEWFADKICVDCGSKENLQLDHIDRSQKISHKIWSWSSERRQAELAKCCARCEECHKKKTLKDFNWGHIVHGDYYRGYRNGCRCDECRMARRDNARAYRERLRRSSSTESSTSVLTK